MGGEMGCNKPYHRLCLRRANKRLTTLTASGRLSHSTLRTRMAPRNLVPQGP